LAHIKAREAYKAAFWTTYDATVAENPDAHAALHAAGEIGKQVYCNVACATFLTAMPNEVEGEDRPTADYATPLRAIGLGRRERLLAQASL
jgi:hypothetical protein